MGRIGNRAQRGITTAMVLSVLLLAACGSSNTTTTTAPTSGATEISTQASIAAEVPSAIKSGGPLQIASDASYQPNEFVDPSTGQVKGWDIDLAQAVCKVWGVQCKINNVTFADIIPALLESPPKYVMAWSSYSPTAPREAKGIDFVTYAKVGESWVEHVGGPTISQPSDMCGHTVAVEGGTTEESDAWGYMGANPGGGAIAGDTNNCKTAGKADITVQSFGTQTQADAALSSGRSDFGWLDASVSFYEAKVRAGKLQIGGQTCGIAPYGVALAHSSGLQQATQDAIKYLIDHGFYKQILDSWNVASVGVSTSDVAVNVNTSSGTGTQACVPKY
ncbi:MAG: transporter substrate-binding domain-containing protein [Candidatus Dormibacteraeota bacterium]|uniref:Transporter substrate-binding domain-containing protein n=1 Tax=Candidatus Aeolococcus gillhamiae TaxID=3127015 RepID=A0A934K1F9_9BACT|nr:transporter substrate-binding domain-containing protein [Candidatus Dormibacteraeota bacterium]